MLCHSGICCVHLCIANLFTSNCFVTKQSFETMSILPCLSLLIALKSKTPGSRIFRSNNSILTLVFVINYNKTLLINISVWHFWNWIYQTQRLIFSSKLMQYFTPKREFKVFFDSICNFLLQYPNTHWKFTTTTKHSCEVVTNKICNGNGREN